jgi:hypothetical protein
MNTILMGLKLYLGYILGGLIITGLVVFLAVVGLMLLSRFG